MQTQTQPHQKREVFNPFTSLSSTDSRDTSLSSLINSDIGICPKCRQPMGRAVIADSAQVFYCAKDRVALPLPNQVEC